MCLLPAYVCVMYKCHSTHVKVNSFLLLCMLWRFNSGHQIHQQVPLLTEPSQQNPGSQLQNITEKCIFIYLSVNSPTHCISLLLLISFWMCCFPGSLLASLFIQHMLILKRTETVPVKQHGNFKEKLFLTVHAEWIALCFSAELLPLGFPEDFQLFLFTAVSRQTL